MASGVYTRFKFNVLKGMMDLATNTCKVALYGASFSFNAAHTVYSVSMELLGVGGYTAGGATLASPTVTEGATTVFDGTDTAWSSATFTVNFAVIYDVTPCNTLVCVIDLGGAQTVTAATFTIQYASSGILRLT